MARSTPHRGRRGNALLEFVLTLPIIFFITGLIMYTSFAMLTKQKALVSARHGLWRSARGSWSPMKLEGWEPAMDDPDADEGSRPRGQGEELERLRPEVEPETIQQIANTKAIDFWNRLWGNLPGRHRKDAHKSFQASGSMWNWLERTAHGRHYRDSSAWQWRHLDAWEIARSGPIETVFDSFRDNLQGDVEEHFQPIRDDILNRWFHARNEELLEEDD